MAKQDVFFRTGYNYDTDAVSLANGFESDEPSLTRQEFAEECDINFLIERFLKTGEVPPTYVPVDIDYAGVVDYQSLVNAQMEMYDNFLQLPAKLREEFGNDPGSLVNFLGDPGNRGRAVELGLVNAPVPQEVVPPVDVPPKAD